MKELNESVERIIKNGGDIMPTLADRLRQEGRQEGIQENAENIVINSLKEGLPINTIVNITGLPLERIKQLKLKVTLEQSSQIANAEQTARTGAEHRV